VPDVRDLPVLHVGEELRRIIAERRQKRRRLAIAALAGFAVVPLAASMLWRPPVLLVWNASTSAPVGLYQVRTDELPDPGDMVVAWTPQPARALAAARRYIPANVPLVKRVAAASGDRVCASGEAISINGRRTAARRRADAAGRPMPWWHGCRVLARHEYLLLMDSRNSFDGRYFGPTGRTEIVGRAALLWAKPAKGSNDG
jgi:conjugative transfer signal peptidase TraF